MGRETASASWISLSTSASPPQFGAKMTDFSISHKLSNEGLSMLQYSIR